MAKATVRLRQASLLAAALALAGCGGSGGSTESTNLSGSIVKGPVNGSQVCAYAATSAGKGTLLGCTTTSSTGAYTLQVGSTGDIVIEATGGTYTDEATSTSKTLADPMQVVVAGSAGGSVTGIVTPLTSVAYSMAKAGTGGVTSASFGTAIAQVATSFGLTGTNLTTTVPVVTGTPDAYGRMLRAVSRYVADGGKLATFLATPGSTQAALQAAYFTINGSNITLNLGNLATTSPGGTTGGGTTGGAGSLTVSFAVNGAGGTSLPSVTIPGVPAPPAGTFCSGLSAADANLAALKALGSLAINSCSASGNTYTVQMTVTMANPSISVPYTVTYAYN